MAIPTDFDYSKSWRSSIDFPAYEDNEIQVRDDMQCLYDEARDAINALGEGVRDALGNGGVDTEGLADGAVTTAKLDDEAVTNEKLGIGAVASYNIAYGQVREDNIHSGAVTHGKLGTYCVFGDNIEDGEVTYGKLSPSVQASLDRADTALQEAPVTSVNGQTGDVTISEIIGPDAVDTVNIKEGAVKTAQIDSKAVTQGKLADAVSAQLLPHWTGTQAQYDALLRHDADTTYYIVAALSSIAVTTPPTKSSYLVGEELELHGIVVTATFEDGSTDDVTGGCSFLPADGATLSTVGTQTVAVSYLENGVAANTSFTVTVSAGVTE